MEEEGFPLSPSNRPKISSSSGKKNKGTMEESPSSPPGHSSSGGSGAAESDDVVCGICLSSSSSEEVGGSRSSSMIRGRIDSCEHYFCFVCIMEWAKVESRCPMCKQRFASIHRPALPPLFPRDRFVRVPVRNQVYHFLGNATVGEIDPYVDVTCSECLSSGDEQLMLLCDLCDSGAHTYCVGLGATVPEGDWYCHDCTISRMEHSESQADDDYSNHYNPTTSVKLQKAGPPISGSNIVCDAPSSTLSLRSGIRVRGVESDGGRLPSGGASERESGGPSSHSDQVPSPMVPVRVTSSSSHRAEPTEQGARTLQRCRNLHDRIRLLRENWHGLRNGSLSFTSSGASSGSMNNGREHNSRQLISGISRQMQSPAAHNAEVTVGTSGYSEMSSCTRTNDVNKAWKMMDIAKSIQGAQKGARSDYHPTGFSHKRKIPGCKMLVDRVPSRTGSDKCCSQNSFQSVQKKYKSLSSDSEKQKPGKHRMKEILQNNRGTLSFSDPDLKSTRILRHGKEGLEHLSGMHEASISVNQCHAPACSGSFTRLPSEALSQCLGNMKPTETLRCEKLPPKVNSGVDKNVNEHSTRSFESAKSEVQSLVKLNLKLQCVDRHLGAEKFKEVARAATHTILAACKLEHTTANSRPPLDVVCKHPDRVKHLRRSNLMPTSCRECFFSFVKDVVDSLVSEKTTLSYSS